MSFSLVNPINAYADETLWSRTSSSGYTVNQGVDIQTVTSGSRLSMVGFYVNKSNPDLLVAQIYMDQPLREQPLASDKKIAGGLWLYSKTRNCLNDKNCEQVLQIALPINNLVSADFISTDTEPIQYGNGNFENFKASGCLSPVRALQNLSGRGVYEIALSITCLGIPKSFYSYAYMSEDIGLSNKVYNFTNIDSTDYPFFELAKKHYDSNGGIDGFKILSAAQGIYKLTSQSLATAKENVKNFKVAAKILTQKNKAKNSKKLTGKIKELELQIKELKRVQSASDFSKFAPDLKSRTATLSSLLSKIIGLQSEMARLTL
jgi:hypothetical protein